MYGVWILSNFVSSIYGIAPPFTVGHDGELELPCSEELWQAQNETEWNEARNADADRGSGVAITIKDAFAHLVDNNEYELPGLPDTTALKWSPFAVVCIMHILSTRLWHVSHGTLSAVTATHGTVWTASSSESSKNEAVPKPFPAGSRCHDFIRAYSEHIEQDSTLARTKDAKWQLANAADVLRVCYGRTVPALSRLDYDTLLRGSLEEVQVAIDEHVRTPLERNAEFTLAAAVAYEGLCVPIRYGTQIYRKTGALSGSLEHLIAGWDSGKCRR